MPDANDPSKNAPPPPPPVTRKFGIAVLMLVGLYTVAVLLGLKPERRIDVATLGIIGLGALIAAVLFRPDIVDRISHVEIAGWKLEIDKKQQKQDKQLQDIEIVLAILLTEAEQKHLLNLAGNNTANYDGSHILRTELRRLADMHLIRRRKDREMRGIPDNVKVNLADFVRLTETGDRLVARIRQINKENEEQKTTAAATG
jgi:hypothetical protein